MPRSIEFAVEPALDAVMEQFRHRGYSGTSIKALELATGLSSGSLYNSFGDKKAVFVKALTHYNRVVVVARISEHLAGQTPVEGLRSLFLSLLEEPDGGSNGCLLTNSAVEFGSSDTVPKTGVQDGFEMQEGSFLEAIERAFPTSDVTGQQSVKLLALYQGILVLIRSGYSKSKLRDMINHEFNDLKGDLE